MKTILYQKTKLNKVQCWEIELKDKGDSGFPEVWVTHGQLNGKQQTTFDIIKEGVNKGKANETTPLQQAQLEMERKITKQIDDGYKRSIEEANEIKTIDFTKPMDKSLCFYKPKSKIEDDKLAALEKSKKLVCSLKRDGQMFVVRSSSDFGVEIWSRKMDLSTDKFPHISEAHQNLPVGTILLGEMVFINPDGTDNFKLASSICRSDPDEAVRKQKEFGFLKYYNYDLAFSNYENLLITKRFSERRKILKTLIPKSEHLLLSTIFNKSVDECMKEVEEKHLEGLVLWDDSKLIKPEDAFSFNGSANRPGCAFKRKNFKEDDFIVRWDPSKGIGDYGKGKLKEWLGNAFIYQLQDGKEVFLGKVGGGLSEDLRKFYTDLSIFPRVWAIKYEFAQPKTGKLRFPVFMRDRTTNKDKELSECLMSEEIKTAREEGEDDEE